MEIESIGEAGPAPEVAESGQSSLVVRSFAKGPQTDEATVEVDVVKGGTKEKMPIAASEAAEEPTTFGVDITMDESHKARPLEVSIEMALPIDAPSTQVDEVGPSETVTSPVTETVQEST